MSMRERGGGGDAGVLLEKNLYAVRVGCAVRVTPCRSSPLSLLPHLVGKPTRYDRGWVHILRYCSETHPGISSP